MAKQKLTDREAKAILRDWPSQTNALYETKSPTEFWLQARPKHDESAVTAPSLNFPGSKRFHTVPDAMWLYLQPPYFASVIVVEVCCDVTNLRDKRSRYFPTGSALLVTCKKKWLSESIKIKGGGMRPRWRAAGSIDTEPTADLTLPVRHLRVLYALPKNDYTDWMNNSAPAAHEFFCRHSSLGTYKEQKMQQFLRTLSPKAHFLTAR